MQGGPTFDSFFWPSNSNSNSNSIRQGHIQKSLTHMGTQSPNVRLTTLALWIRLPTITEPSAIERSFGPSPNPVHLLPRCIVCYYFHQKGNEFMLPSRDKCDQWI
jgi:hypothetical protein